MARTVALRPTTDLPTLGLIVLTYGAFGAATWFHAALPWWVLAPLGAVIVCFYGSLQHEAVHGFPCRAPWLNALLFLPPLNLWMPYSIYRETHLIHHRDEYLTLPGVDPESFYIDAATWQRLPRWYRWLLDICNTLLGRLLLGPFVSAGTTFVQAARGILAGDRTAIRDWSSYALGLGLVGIWVVTICGMDPLLYIACFAYPGTALTLLRSFAEHRAAVEPASRTAIVEPGWFFGLLFLFNSYHVVHHDEPGLAWYRRSARYRERREALIAANSDNFFDGYAAVARRFLLRRKEPVVHPLGG